MKIVDVDELGLRKQDRTKYAVPEYADGFNYVVDLIEKAPTIYEWISVEDRLPKPYDKDPDWTETVLFRTIQGHIHSGYRYKAQVETSFSPSYWLDESEHLSFEDEDVTHWMQLPKMSQ